MKLASLKQRRDGKLAVVSNDLTRAVSAEDIAPTLQAALDNWSVCEPKLRELSKQLEQGSVPGFRFS
jgi:fumarylacetoacetate (FAA) hydrolase